MVVETTKVESEEEADFGNFGDVPAQEDEEDGADDGWANDFDEPAPVEPESLVAE